MKEIVTENQEINYELKNNNKPKKERKPSILRAALVCFLAMTVICGFVYTFAVTLTAQVLFPYEANGSVIKIQTNDGTERIIGSELIGQSYILFDSNGQPALTDGANKYYTTTSSGELVVDNEGNPIYYLDENRNGTIDDGEDKVLAEDTTTYVVYQAKYLIGRNNSGAPSNASPNSPIYKEELVARKEALELIGYNNAYNEAHDFAGLPDEMITESGSGCDPEISYETAMYQVPLIAQTRNMTEDAVIEIIDTYTKGRFLGIFGTKRVNVLLVNLALDGLI